MDTTFSNVQFRGVMPAIVTPLCEDESLNARTAERLVQWHLQEGMDGFYICGGTGEGPGLQKNVRMEMAELVCSKVRGQAASIVHVGAIDLVTARELARHAGHIGASAISSVPPFFFGYGEAEIRRYYEELSQAAGLPVLMYASPLAGINITWDMVDRLMDVPGMIGLKWTSADYYTMRRIKELRRGNINVINGPDETLLCGLMMGADGGIGATYNLAPGIYRRLYDAFRAGDWEKARKAQLESDHLVDVLVRYGVVPAIKAALGMLGFDCGACVAPTRRLGNSECAALRTELHALEIPGF